MVFFRVKVWSGEEESASERTHEGERILGRIFLRYLGSGNSRLAKWSAIFFGAVEKSGCLIIAKLGNSTVPVLLSVGLYEKEEVVWKEGGKAVFQLACVPFLAEVDIVGWILSVKIKAGI